MITIKKATKIQIETVLKEEWEGNYIVSRRKIHKASELDGFSAYFNNLFSGLITYHIQSHNCEITSLNSYKEKKGIGTKLIDTVIQHAQKKNYQKVWLITTNDNTYALRFYQKRGFDLIALHKDEIEYSRKLKPSIPKLGFDNIPIKHEIELEYKIK